MEIGLKLNGTQYGILVESNQYIPVRYSVNEDEKSKNYGTTKSVHLGYVSSLQNACKFIIRDKLASSEDKVSLSEFVNRVEELNNELTEQLKVLQLD